MISIFSMISEAQIESAISWHFAKVSPGKGLLTHSYSKQMSSPSRGP